MPKTNRIHKHIQLSALQWKCTIYWVPVFCKLFTRKHQNSIFFIEEFLIGGRKSSGFATKMMCSLHTIELILCVSMKLSLN